MIAVNRRTRLFVASGFALAGLACLAALGVYSALRRAPADYEAALVRDVAAAARSSDEFLQSAAAVASDVRKAGAWDAVFTADQINGWLAVDVPQNFPELLPAEFAAPRVFIHPGDLTIACRYGGSVDTVLSIACDVYLQAPNVLAIRIKAARAGLLPLPLGNVLNAITHAAQNLELPLEWRRVGGDPVALVSIVPPHARGKERVELERVELREGEVAVVGHTGDGGPLALASRSKGGGAPAESPETVHSPGAGSPGAPADSAPNAASPDAKSPAAASPGALIETRQR